MSDSPVACAVRSIRSVAGKMHNLMTNMGNQNVVFCPIAFHTALGLAFMGASGDTKEELAACLGVDDPKILIDGYKHMMKSLIYLENVYFIMGNRLYISKKLDVEPDYETHALRSFKSSVEKITCRRKNETAKTINAFLKDRSSNKIKIAVTPGTVKDSCGVGFSVITSATFSAWWHTRIRKVDTVMEPFYISENYSVNTKMMHVTGKFGYCNNTPNLKAEIVEMPYSNKSVSFLLIVPKDIYGIQQLDAIQGNIDVVKLVERLVDTRVSIALPKLKIDMTVSVTGPVEEMQLNDMFDSDKATFNEMASGGPIKCDWIFHKIFLEINEESTEPLNGIYEPRMKPTPTSLPLAANHPFLFFIIHKDSLWNTVNILFQGKVVNPTQLT